MSAPQQEHSAWSEWINQKFDEYRAKGRDYTLARFSRQFGASHSIVLGWMRPGAEPPRKKEYRELLLKMYGREAYAPLGLPEPEKEIVVEGETLNENEKRALDLFRQMPNDLQGDAVAALESFLFNHGFRRTR